MLPLVVLWIQVAVWSPGASGGEGGRIHGQVLDSSGLPLANSNIRAIGTSYRTRSAADGSFLLDSIQPGVYRLAISLPGFRVQFIDNVHVYEGGEVDLGATRLPPAGCDAPGVMCDSFSAKTPPDKTISAAYVTVPLGCAANLESGKVQCNSAASDRRSDFRVRSPGDGHLYFEPRRKAQLAEPNTSANCRSAVFLRRNMQVDGLGPGSDLCIRSNAGHYAHVFFMAEVQADSERIEIYYVTRR